MEALQYSLPYHGKGVGIAILDTGIAPHPDLGDRLVAFTDMVDGSRRPVDEVGHGTHVAGDAAGDGKASGGRFAGAAPEANLIGIRVLGGGLEGEDVGQALHDVAAGLRWMVDNKARYNIRVANLSLGIPLAGLSDGYGVFGTRSDLLDPLEDAVNAAVAAGIVVVVAAGNDGERGSGSIDGTPATNPNVITVGALDPKGTRQRADDDVAPFSSQGPTPEGRHKPDVVAPGANIMSLNVPGSQIEQENREEAEQAALLDEASPSELRMLARQLVLEGMLPREVLTRPAAEMREAIASLMQPHETAVPRGSSSAYLAMDGTSMAAPIVAGICADMIEANPALTPQQVKDILMRTARPLEGVDRHLQGAGVVDPQAAVALAEKMRAYPGQRFEVSA